MRSSKPLVVIACLGVTGANVAWADPTPQLGVEYVESPFAPHDTHGSTLRLGTSVGFIHGQRQDVRTLGGTLAGGQRFGRLALEAELGLANLNATDLTDARLGTQERLGLTARFDVLRLESHVVGPNTLFAVYVEGGAAKVWTAWGKPAAGDAERMVPENTGRVEGQVGFGIMLDHRLQEPVTVPRRVGWFLGWRMAFAPHASESAAVCRGLTCRVATPMPDATYTDRTMLFQSSMQVTW